MLSGLIGKRILIVEDEFLIAEQLYDLVDAAGAFVVGPVTGLSAAVSFAERRRLDGALLDFRLGEGTTAPVASALAQRGVPFIVISAYKSSSLPLELKEAPYLSKPFRTDTLLELASYVFGGRADGPQQPVRING